MKSIYANTSVQTRKEDMLYSKSDCVTTKANCSKVCVTFQNSTGPVYKGTGYFIACSSNSSQKEMKERP